MWSCLLGRTVLFVNVSSALFVCFVLLFLFVAATLGYL